MELLFLGRGSAFNTIEGNNSAYFIDKNELFLIDCGESIFERIIEKDLLKDVECVNVMITHTHSDHVGSIGSLIMYCYYVIKKNVNIIISRDSLYKNDIIDLIRIFGCTSDMYCVIYDDEYDDKYDLFSSIRFLKTNHVSQIPSYGILFNTNNGIVYYSGDTSDLNNILDLINSNLIIDKIYIDSTSINAMNNVHVFIGELNEKIPDFFKNKVYCMHINDEKCINKALEYGFNIVKFDNN
jgi:ribonuclease BN (tRNA processing enzyme)